MSFASKLLTTALLASLGGCASTWQLTGGSAVPAAVGVATTKVGGNGNTNVDLKVKHLAMADRVNAGATTYVVWATANGDNANAMNIGALKLDKNLDGTLETKTAMRDFKLTVTAEPDGTAQHPSGPVVLSGTINSK
ncbi:MAG: anti-sigma factor [Polyangia bacterium]